MWANKGNYPTFVWTVGSAEKWRTLWAIQWAGSFEHLKLILRPSLLKQLRQEQLLQSDYFLSNESEGTERVDNEEANW